MKLNFFTTLLFLILAENLNAQRLGYKEFQIGKSLKNGEFDNYDIIRLKNGSDSNFYAIYLDNTMLFCDVPLTSVVMQTDSLKVIDNLTIYTKSISFADFDTYFKKFMEVVDCAINVFGKANAVSLENKERKFIVVWDLTDVNIHLRIEAESMGTFAKNENRNLTVSWSKKRRAKLW